MIGTAELSIIFDLPQLWDEEAQAIVREACLTFGAKMMKFTGLDPVTSFNRIFGVTHFRFNRSIKNHAYSGSGKIIFQLRKYVGLALIIHELAHILNIMAGLAASRKLWNDKIDTAKGSFWSGMHPPKIAGYNVIEKWSNLCADYVLGMLDLDDDKGPGMALLNWIESNLPTLIKKIIARTK